MEKANNTDIKSQALEIIFEDDDLIAINKPHGLLVHRSKMALNTDKFAVQELRNQIGMHVYPCHRLDRKTSGVLLFAKNELNNKKAQALFRENKVEKEYRAIVRGFVINGGEIDYALDYNGKHQEAKTIYNPIRQFEIPFEYKGFQTMRYTLISLQPITGRFHQLRKHMAHIFHPIIGDRPHGCNKQNRIWKHEFGMDTMMLHACQLKFKSENKDIQINADLSPQFQQALDWLDQKTIL